MTSSHSDNTTENRKPKLIRIAHSLLPSGRKNTLLAIHRGVAERFDQQLWTLESDSVAGEVRADRYFPHGRGLSLRLLWRLRSAIRAARPDIVHTHGTLAHTYGLPAAWLASVRIILATDHRGDASQEQQFKQRLRNKLAFSFAGKIVCLSDDQNTRLQSAYGFSPQKWSRIYVGIPLDLFQAIPAQPASSPGDKRIVLCTCHLRVEKNHEMLLQAFARMPDRLNDTELWLAGRAEVGRRELLQSMCAELGLAARVKFLGQCSDIPELLRHTTLLAHPTRIEALGRSLIEASAAARPIVTTRVGGIPEVVEDGVTGLLFEPDDVEGFARGMTALLDDPDRAVQMGIAGRKRADRLFSLNQMTRGYGELYDALLAGKET